MSVIFESHDHIATITLDRPEKLNALTLEMLDQLEAHLATIEADASIRALVITGAGDRSFCVGADIHAWSSLNAVEMWRDWIGKGHRIFGRLSALRVPTITALNGYTFGGGLELALATDIRIADKQVEFALPEVKLGIVPGWTGTQKLPALIGAPRAKQMVFSGERIDTQRALEWGLINEIALNETSIDRARALAGTISGNAPLAVQMTKQLIDGGGESLTGYHLEALASGFARFTEDAKEGIASFKEKRSPAFKGR